MKVKFTGNYRGHAAVTYKGVVFIDGEATEVSEEWLEQNESFHVEPVKRRGRPPKKVADNDNDDGHSEQGTDSPECSDS